MFKTISEIVIKNKQNHEGHWFSAGAFRFFHTEIESDVIGGRYFITSERMQPKMKKEYTIRMSTDSGEIETVGDFLEYSDLDDALAELGEIRMRRA